MPLSRLALIVGFVLIVAAALGYAFWPRPLTVEIATVERGDLRVAVEGEGQTRVKDVFTVSAPVAGRVLRLAAEVGDTVEGGRTMLAVIQPTDPAFLDPRAQAQAEAMIRAADAARVQAEADLGRARAELAFARSEYQRALALARTQAVSPRAVERAELDLRTREAAIGTAEAALRVRTAELENARAMRIGPRQEADPRAACCVQVVAPHDGQVLRIIQRSESVVLAGAPLIEIGDTSSLEIVVDLLSADAVQVEPGAPVAIRDWGGGETLRGAVVRVEPFGFTKVSALGIEEQRVNVVIAFVSPRAAWRRLGHGYRVEASIELWRGADVVLAPVGALFRASGGWAAFVVVDGRARLRPVTLGQRNQSHAEIQAGVAPGDTLVLYPADRIRDGARVTASP